MELDHRPVFASAKVWKEEGRNLSSMCVKIRIGGEDHYLPVSIAGELGRDILLAAGEAWGKRNERDTNDIRNNRV